MIFTKLLNRLRFRLSAWIQPRMVYGFRRYDGVYLRRTRLSNLTRVEHAHRLDIGDNVYIGHFNFVDASGGLTIGEGCQITNYVSILTHSSHIAIRLYGRHYLDHRNHAGYLRKSSVIGRYSFIGPHSVLMPGTRLGKGSLVSAYSFVAAGDYPDYAVLAGNPAQVVGDTRTMDQEWLSAHPELMALYEEWDRD
ncbi:acyltransferase [Paludibacterium purpuratum]|uniref:Acetyltransferase-like isoleucine patch superfamily enzyme n=1 Tax=Paludibacterium purpuratum TaxID=1144873 RepID=A0A4R7B8H5_9NEIS|nr:acyltransferase [Paludibacterium purpuratum]TDR80182.1 acetyltransferase-like isoleucine patch superfamily enzyme [Paludibacterium purpuratum]